MRTRIRSILALTALFASRLIHARADELNAAPAQAPPGSLAPSDARTGTEKESQKEQVLRLLDHTRALARWMPNASSFLAVLDGVQERVVGAKEIELAPLDEFGPYLSHLTETLARMEARVGSLQTPVELCDVSRRKDLFLLFLDALDVEGQVPVQAMICEKIASGEEAEGGLSQACVATNFAFFAARSMRDLAVVCEPSLARSDASAGRLERLSTELAGVQARVQESVRSAERDLTQAMTVVAGHVADVSSTHTKYLEDLTVRLEIERALQQGLPYGSLYLPEANGGRLEAVRTIVVETIQNVLDSGESANGASAKLAEGDIQLKGGHFKQAFRLYGAAYKAAVGLAPKQQR